jgi:hypothetical protein
MTKRGSDERTSPSLMCFDASKKEKRRKGEKNL